MSTPASQRRWRDRVFGFMVDGFWLGFFAGVAVTAAAFLMSCGSSVTLTPGKAEITHKTTTTVHPDGTITRVIDTGGTSTGAGGSATGDKTDLTGDGAPAPINLPGDGGSVGPSSAPFVLGAKGGGMFANPLLWVGILLCVGGGAAIYFGLRRAAVVAFAVGGGFIVAAMLPVWAWAVIGLAVIGGGAFYLWSELQTKRNREALRAVVAGVENAPPEAQAAVKAEVAKQAEGPDKAVIAGIKKADNL